jgi:hypothetical protein
MDHYFCASEYALSVNKLRMFMLSVVVFVRILLIKLGNCFRWMFFMIDFFEVPMVDNVSFQFVNPGIFVLVMHFCTATAAMRKMFRGGMVCVAIFSMC